VIAMTANALSGDRDRCLAAGMNDYVSKPINTAQLRAVLRAVIENQPHGSSKGPPQHPPDGTPDRLPVLAGGGMTPGRRPAYRGT
jgi:DNA-binding response OmpR family regulator